ncbi:hypothetical protein R1flu_009433 [Riccia fluitans]|uniref:Uncharacterized protein n=1 Tax=Riccia fluitans TaxID=41844 RepID=A0ABD1Z230_9MARC
MKPMDDEFDDLEVKAVVVQVRRTKITDWYALLREYLRTRKIPMVLDYKEQNKLVRKAKGYALRDDDQLSFQFVDQQWQKVVDEEQ